jgi:hypothetical protein
MNQIIFNLTKRSRKEIKRSNSQIYFYDSFVIFLPSQELIRFIFKTSKKVLITFHIDKSTGKSTIKLDKRT